MATYYKYAERNAADQVDWSAIGKSITDTLSDELKRREDAKQKIADASNKDAETLSNAPMGQSKGINDFTLSFANNAEQFRLMQDRMLQSGRMKLRDYNIGRANLMSGTKELFNLSKEYNAVYNEKMKRQQDKDSQAFETWAMGNIEGYSNFSNTGAYIDPNTGRVSLAKKIETTQPDGTVIYEISKNPNDFKSVNELRNIINVKYNRFKVAENLQPEVDSLGEYVKVQMKDGVKTLEDVKKSEGYKKVRDQYINSIIETNPDNVMSILTDYIGAVINEDGEPGESFDFTYDPNEATSENMILMVRNPNTDRFEADFSTANGKKQKEMARKALQAKFDSMIDVKETPMTVVNPNSVSMLKYQKTLETGADLAQVLTRALTAQTEEEALKALALLPTFGLNTRGAAKKGDALTFEVYNTATKKYEEVPVSYTGLTTQEAVRDLMIRLLGKKADIKGMLGKLPKNYFDDKTITNIEAIFKPKEVVEIKDIDDVTNFIADPTKTPKTQKDVVEMQMTVSALIDELATNSFDNDEIPIVLRKILEKQGIDDAQIILNEDVGTRGVLTDMLGTTDNQDFISITSPKYYPEAKKFTRSEFFEGIKEFLDILTKRRQQEETFGSGAGIGGNLNQTQTPGELDN
tara:strand:- start:6007 stop:7914 length:1908 start_codon:yes stop_codon:yes gene_type:complete